MHMHTVSLFHIHTFKYISVYMYVVFTVKMVVCLILAGLFPQKSSKSVANFVEPDLQAMTSERQRDAERERERCMHTCIFIHHDSSPIMREIDTHTHEKHTSCLVTLTLAPCIYNRRTMYIHLATPSLTHISIFMREREIHTHIHVHIHKHLH